MLVTHTNTLISVEAMIFDTLALSTQASRIKTIFRMDDLHDLAVTLGLTQSEMEYYK